MVSKKLIVLLSLAQSAHAFVAQSSWLSQTVIQQRSPRAVHLNFFGNKGGGASADNGADGAKRVAAELKNPVVLFTTATCPFCKQAKSLLDSTGAKYKEVCNDSCSTQGSLIAPSKSY